MPIWTLTPSATPDDPNWANARIYPRVVLRAETSGEARAMAAAMEAREADHDPADQVGTQAMDLPSAFLDPKLYRVVRGPDAPGAPGIIEAAAPIVGGGADAPPG
ncbi:MAG: hypothetical protein AAF321_01955 [Pseudomonadota bacterium]